MMAARDLKVGRYREKLEQIRDSLKPFVQSQDEPIATPSYTVSLDQQEQMIKLMTQAGTDRALASRALQIVQFKSITAANQLLNQLRNPSDLRQSDRDHQVYNPQLPNQSLNSINSSGYGGSSLMSTNNFGSTPNFGNFAGQPYGFASTSYVEESESPRSASPSAHQMATMQSPYQNRAYLPAPPKGNCRSHVHMQIRQPEPGEEIPRIPRVVPSTARGPMISIERAPKKETSRAWMNMGEGEAPRKEPIQWIKATMIAPPSAANQVHIKINPSTKESYAYATHYLAPSGVSTVTGVPTGMQGVQNILVDPDISREPHQMKHYRDKFCPRGPRIEHHGHKIGRVSPNQMPSTSRDYYPPERSSPSGPTCHLSSLPTSVEKRIRDKTFESAVKPITPHLYRFFMEQHVERVVQAHRERQKRAMQLQKEMEAVNMSDMMKDSMLSFLIQKENRDKKMSTKMFEVLKEIGVGAFGRVALVKKKDTEQQASHVKAERDILAEANSPWIVKLFFSFQDERCLYFIMEYVPGGDMMGMLITMGIFPEKLARFYTAELTCALEYVHSLKFIHRDIKPDNILIDREGHIKLTDFGLCTGLRWTHDRRYYGPENEDYPSHSRHDSLTLPDDLKRALKENSKLLPGRLSHYHGRQRHQALSVVGTGNYMAPEVVRKTGHTQLCDWWSVGVILYEMVIGRPPFMSMTDDPNETQMKIDQWPEFLDLSLQCTQHLSRECVRMIRQLISEQSERIGGRAGASELMAHPWFKGIDFATLRQQKAEHVPRVEHQEDTQNFETIESAESPFETLSKGKAPANPAFYEFTFRHFFDYDGQGCPSLRPSKRPSLAPLFENGHSGGMSSGIGHHSPSTASQRPSGRPSTHLQHFGGLYNSPLHEDDDDDSGESFVV
ncbi:unnamed protein product, partial [Mesorhabditis spiculigera]